VAFPELADDVVLVLILLINQMMVIEEVLEIIGLEEDIVLYTHPLMYLVMIHKNMVLVIFRLMTNIQMQK